MASSLKPGGPLAATTIEEYHSLLESFAKAIWETDPSGKAVTDSLSWRAYTGQSLEQWLAEGWLATVHPDDQSDAIAHWQESVRQQTSFNGQFRIARQEGGWQWTAMQATPVLDPGGSIKKWLGISMELAEKNQLLVKPSVDCDAPSPRASSEQLLQATLDASVAMIQVFQAVRDEAGQIIDFIWIVNNHASEQYYGNVIGKSLLTLNPGVVEAGIFDTFKQVVETGISDQSERHYIHEQFNGWYYQSAVKFGDGLATTTLDITGLKQAEIALSQSEEFLQSVIDSSLDVIQAFQAVRDESGQILDFIWVMNNRKAVEQNGNVIGESLLKQNPGVVQTGIFEHMVEVAQTGIPYEHELHYSYEQFNGWFYQALVKTNQGLAMTTRNITAQKQAQSEIIRLQEEIAQQATDKYYSIFNSIEEGFCIYELVYDDSGKPFDVKWVELNPAFQKHTGLKGEVGKTHRELALATEHYWFELFDQVVQTGKAEHSEQWHGPTGRWYDTFTSRIGEAQARQVAVVFSDVTDRKWQQQRQDFLLRFSDSLRVLAHSDTIANTALRLLSDHLKSDRSYIGVYRLADDRGDFTHQFGNEKVPPVPAGVRLSDFPDALRTAFDRTLVINDVMTAEGLTDTDRQNLSALGFGALVASTLRKGENNPLWAIVVVSATARIWTSGEVGLIDEVTERTWSFIEQARAEATLRKSEEQYRTVFDSIDEGFHISELVYDGSGRAVDWRYLEVNPVFEKQTGLKGVVGRLGSEVAPGTEAHWFDAYDRVLKTGDPMRMEANNQTTDRWYSAHTSRVGGPGSNQFVVVFQDITERKHHEQFHAYLLKLNDALRPLSDPLAIQHKALGLLRQHLNAPRAIYEEALDQQGTMRISAEHLEAGLPPMEGSITRFSDFAPDALAKVMSGKPLWQEDVLHEDHSPGHQAGYAALGTRAWLMVPLVKDGKIVTNLTVHNSEPRIWKPQEIRLVQETTERTWAAVERAQSEKDLRRIKQRQSAILESATDYAIFTPDMNLNVLDWNAGAEKVLGYSEQEIVGQPGEIFFVPEDRAKGAPGHEMEKAIQEGRAENERWHLRKNGSRFYGSGVTTPLVDEAGTVIGLLKVMRDLTVQKQAEDALREADMRKDHFLAMLAHELRNPLSTVQNGVSLLKITQKEQNDAFETIKMMDRQVVHLVRMVDDLLDVSRVTQGKIQLQLERLDIASVVTLAVKAIQPQFEQAGKELHLAALPAAVIVEGDATRLSQVVTNILTNSLRYTGADGQVWVSVETIDRQVLIRVRDNGIGLTTGQLTSVFELFVQADNSLARSQGGLGIGLTLVRQLVGMHGGRVQARSAGIGHGSEFTVYLPVIELPSQAQISDEADQPSMQSPMRILVIDDVEDLAKLTSMLLRYKGYQTEFRTSGSAGIEAVESFKPHVVLCDIGMPGMDGYAVARLIRKGTWGRTVLLIALSGYGQPEDIARAKEAGFDSHLTKPVDVDQVQASIASLRQAGTS